MQALRGVSHEHLKSEEESPKKNEAKKKVGGIFQTIEASFLS